MEDELRTMIEGEVAGISSAEIDRTRVMVLEMDMAMARDLTHLFGVGLWIDLGRVYGHDEEGSEEIREVETLMAELLGKRMGGEVSVEIVDRNHGGASLIEVTVSSKDDELEQAIERDIGNMHELGIDAVKKAIDEDRSSGITRYLDKSVLRSLFTALDDDNTRTITDAQELVSGLVGSRISNKVTTEIRRSAISYRTTVVVIHPIKDDK